MRWALLAVFLATPALAWDPSQADKDHPEISAWFGRQRVPDSPSSSCCGLADAYYADSVTTEGDQHIAIITDERVVEGRVPIAPGTRFVVPPSKMNNGSRAGKHDPNPTGHGIIFINPNAGEGASGVLCYFAPGLT